MFKYFSICGNLSVNLNICCEWVVVCCYLKKNHFYIIWDNLNRLGMHIQDHTVPNSRTDETIVPLLLYICLKNEPGCIDCCWMSNVQCTILKKYSYETKGEPFICCVVLCLNMRNKWARYSKVFILSTYGELNCNI